MKKYRFFVGFFGAFAISVPLVVFADEQRDIPLQISILSHNTVQNMAEYIDLMYRYLTSIAGVMAVAMIMYGGMKWIFAGGDSGKIGAAKEVISHAVIGLILVLGSYLILNTINPNLLNLEVEVMTIPRSALPSGFCPNEGESEGDYICGQVYTITEGGGGSCIGAHCDTGTGGCYQYQGSYGCIQTDQCPSTCDGINAMRGITNDNQLRAACGSRACKDATTFGCRVLETSSFSTNHPNTKCIDRLRVGDYFCEGNEDCAYGLMCNFGEAPNACRDAKGLGAGESCDNDRVCLSGICNKGRINDECTPVGGEPAGEVCDRDRDCGYHLGSELVCNETAFGDSCIPKNSLEADERCRRDIECKSNNCGEGNTSLSIDGRCQ